eukprot:6187059-Pleurochrysis_carterae.AAC.1
MKQYLPGSTYHPASRSQSDFALGPLRAVSHYSHVPSSSAARFEQLTRTLEILLFFQLSRQAGIKVLRCAFTSNIRRSCTNGKVRSCQMTFLL